MRNKIFLCLLLTLFIPSIYANNSSSNKENYLKLGGAVRFNTYFKNFEENNHTLDTNISFDVLMLSVNARQKGFDLSAEYRFYPDSKTQFLKQAYIGYALEEEETYFKVGIFQKPFGINQYASHNYFFQLPYYLGLEDSYAIGVGATKQYKRWTFDLAYFRQSSPGGPVRGEDSSVGSGRYAYAIVNTTGIAGGIIKDANIRELDQVNVRARYQLTNEVELGASLQVGRIYNEVLNNSDWSANWATHLVYNKERWNLKTEIIGYDYKAHADDGFLLDAVQMGAYGSAYDVASKGMLYVIGAGYTIPIDRKFIQSITVYVDYSYLHKNNDTYFDTHHLIPGFMITSGPVITYVEYAMGKNQPWFSSSFSGLGEGTEKARWNGRFNINIGYYF